ncbi:uncharacterized protein LOC135395195 [Ornithodoros turicata]|uniref:uncharacterized protein LOC135395195 n=1 Tax=Ornithodoros turicata TaxID=34597 RepID=UPI003139FD29
MPPSATRRKRSVKQQHRGHSPWDDDDEEEHHHHQHQPRSNARSTIVLLSSYLFECMTSTMPSPMNQELAQKPPCSRIIFLNVAALSCLIFNCMELQIYSNALAGSSHLRKVAEETKLPSISVLTAVLFIKVFECSLNAISDVAFVCSQCMGNQLCFYSFLVWNAISIAVCFACDTTLRYTVPQALVQLETATENEYLMQATTEESDASTQSEEANYEKQVTAAKLTRRRHLLAANILQSILPGHSIATNVVQVMFKIMMLMMFKQYIDMIQSTAEPPAIGDESGTQVRRCTQQHLREVQAEVYALQLQYDKSHEADKTPESVSSPPPPFAERLCTVRHSV